LNHPNIVAVYEFGQVNGLPFFLMEFVDGLNLRQLEQAGKLSPREALQIVPQICEALQFAHDEGIVHRDIKPENILDGQKGPGEDRRFRHRQNFGRRSRTGHHRNQRRHRHAALHGAGANGETRDGGSSRGHFFLGVVFYEMLTGELPLGKFPRLPPAKWRWTCGWTTWCCARWKKIRNAATSMSAR
jgi:serine/threonine protein kinase